MFSVMTRAIMSS